MTAIWGPMGWITLHSISVAYPTNPSPEDKAILVRFMEQFRECITCPHCKSHFTSMFGTYKRYHPEWANSKYDLFLAVCRMHNTVNKRLDKPLQKTVQECLDALKLATKHTNSLTFRRSYINHVTRNWAAFQSGDGMIMVGCAKEMAKINEQYWAPRDVDFNEVSFPEANVLEFVPEDRALYKVSDNIPSFVPSQMKSVGFKLSGGKFRLGGR